MTLLAGATAGPGSAAQGPSPSTRSAVSAPGLGAGLSQPAVSKRCTKARKLLIAAQRTGREARTAKAQARVDRLCGAPSPVLEMTAQWPAGTSPAHIALSPRGDRAYVLGQPSCPIPDWQPMAALPSTLTILDTSSGQVVGNVPVGAGALSVAVSSDGATVAVGLAEGAVTLVDTATRAVRTVTTGADGDGALHGTQVAFAPRGSQLYSLAGLPFILKLPDGSVPAGFDTAPKIRLSVIDTQAGTVARTADFAFTTSPRGLAVSPDGATVYMVGAGLWGLGDVPAAVAAIRTSDLGVATVRPASPWAVGASVTSSAIAVDPDGQWLTLWFDGDATRLAASSLATASVTSASSRYDSARDVASYRGGLAVAGRGDVLLATVAAWDEGADGLADEPGALVLLDMRRRIDGAATSNLGQLAMPAGPTDVAVAPDGRTAYVANCLAGTVARVRVNVAGIGSQRPAAPSEVLASPLTGRRGALMAQWSAPEYTTLSAPPTRLQVLTRPGGRTCLESRQTITDVLLGGCAIYGLPPGTEYRVAVRYENRNGWGPWTLSAPVQVR